MSTNRNLSSIATTLVLLIAVMGVAAVAGQVTVPTTFTAGEVASASAVNANFNALAGEINDNDNRLEDVEEYQDHGFITAGVCVNLSGVVNRWFDKRGTLITTVTATRLSAGVYEVDFDRAVTGGYYQATLGNPDSGGNIFAGTIAVQPKAGDANVLRVVVTNSSGVFMDHGFYLLVH